MTCDRKKDEIITDITLIIDEKMIGDIDVKKWINDNYCPEKTGSCYRVFSRDFNKVQQLVKRLSGHLSSSGTQGQTAPPTPCAATCSVPVNRVVMEYIKKKYDEKLKRILGHFVIEFKAANSGPHSTVQVNFRAPSEPAYSSDRVHLDFVRQRFITFYQRTASDLQLTSLHVTPHRAEDLQRKFPLLFFKSGSSKDTAVCGPFAHVQKLKEFISQNPKSSGNSPVKRDPARSQSYKSSAPSPKLSKPPGNEICPICMEPIPPEKKKALQCMHSFCKDCLQRAFDYKPVCPICGEVYGTLKGTQPDGGTMDIRTSSACLPGYERHGTLVIHYHIPSGIQKEEHPNPGQPFEGASRTAYLPDSSEGRKVLELLRKAFNQRLIFTIGRSSTSGRNNMVTWNDIHHKTSMHGGPTSYGYPDPDYLNRVQEELKAKGIK
ncbi:E3 ubiquitin-protein ligase DTX3L-like [Poecilia formosa]|nr:PREDICTED: E3 ubiquitin-protein ligase DTX3L-like [Poecilia formosa]